ncbi:MAG: 2-hydroxyacid dehydrogenase [Hyphomicrobiaceae bacterium]
MLKILVEADPILNVIPVILDPTIPPAHLDAVRDFYTFDVPEFDGWLAGVRQRIPGLYPSRVVFADSQADLADKIRDADAVIVESLNIGETELSNARQLKVAQRWGGQSAGIDVNACTARGVPVSVLRRRVNITVAEQAIALMMILGRRHNQLMGIVEADALKAKGFDLRPYNRTYSGNSNFARIPNVVSMLDSTLGIIGLGEIGREVAIRAKAFGMRTLYYQRSRLPAMDEMLLGATYAPLEEMLPQCDFVSLHLPLNASTRGILGRRHVEQMKKGVFLVNIARARLIDYDAVIWGLESGHLGGFGLDAGYHEPAADGEKLLSFPNAVLLPHTAPAHRMHALRDFEQMMLRMWEYLG